MSLSITGRKRYLFGLASLAVLCSILVAGCTGVGSISRLSQDSGPDRDVDVSGVKDAVPRHEPITKAGNSTPYKVLGKTYRVNFNTKGFSQKGKASWYGKKFHGNKTANGETYDMFAMTAAHKTLPIPSYVRVTNVSNKKSVVVRVNDRGPFHGGRIIDLSYAAAKKLGIQQAGTGDVRVDIVRPHKNAASAVGQEDSYLQIGAFRWRSGALELKKRISQKTHHGIVISSVNKNKLYKVLVGPIRHQSELESLKKKLLAENVSSTHLIKL